jgi:membrane-associated PAP2 superfamily phosphatase
VIAITKTKDADMKHTPIRACALVAALAMILAITSVFFHAGWRFFARYLAYMMGTNVLSEKVNGNLK